MRSRLSTLVALAPVALFSLAGCGDGTATVRVTATDSSAAVQALTDAEVEAFPSIIVNVVSIKVHVVAEDDEESAEEAKHAGEGEDSSGAGWIELLPAAREVDLVKLSAGEIEELTTEEIPAGKLSQIRFVLDETDPGHAVRADGSEVAITIPSGTSSGLKIAAKLDLEAGTEVELPLDFDVSQSLSEANDGTLRIAPLIRLGGE
jgi:hypothetical protein